MIVGMHDMFGSLAKYYRSRVSTEGALWILMMDGLFLIPLIFSLFFYPRQVLIGIAVLVVMTAAIIEAVHFKRTHRVGWGKH